MNRLYGKPGSRPGLARQPGTPGQHYPLSARRRGLSGQVVLQFTIHADGRITDPQITDSTGHAVFRTASLRVLQRVGRMPPFPPELRQRQSSVKIPMLYELETAR